MAEKKEVELVKVCGYQVSEDNEVVSKVFDLEAGSDLPSGWVDTPAKCKKRGRPKAE